MSALDSSRSRPSPGIAGVHADELHEPESVQACSELLRAVAARKQALGIVGGGAALGLGNPPRPLDALVGTRRLDRVVEYAPEDQVIVAEAGLTLARLQALARQNGQWLGVDAPHAEQATLGGLVAVGGFGPRRARYGAVRDLLLGVTLVRADGALARGGGKVVKNVAGFDLPKIVAGSLGTLGLIAQVTLRLHPLPEASATLHCTGLDAARVVSAVLALRRAQIEPSSVVAVWAPDRRYELGVRLEGFGQGVERDARRVEELSREGPWQRLSPSGAEAFWERAEAPRTRGALRVRVTALPTHLLQVHGFLEPLLQALIGARSVWYATLGIGFVAGDPPAMGGVRAALETARAAAVAGGGSLVVDEAPAALRGSGKDRLDAWGPSPGSFGIMQQLKLRFDPEARLNPGRFLGGI